MDGYLELVYYLYFSDLGFALEYSLCVQKAMNDLRLRLLIPKSVVALVLDFDLRHVQFVVDVRLEAELCVEVQLVHHTLLHCIV